jgi:general secretion pathway protein G
VRKHFRAIRDNEGGFTLTELLITIVILGVLAGIVVFAVTGFTGRGKDTACQTDRKNVEIAAEAYYAKYGAYPANAGDSDANIQDLITEGYLKEAPSKLHYTITLADNGTVTGPPLC